MKWNESLHNIKWSQEIKNYDQKLIAAQTIASMIKNGDVIGFGSGSTSFLAVKEIAKKCEKENIVITAIPTSREIKEVCVALGIPTATINELKPDWCFDGADEVDPNGSLIKGRGGAMFNEKLIMINTNIRYIIVDKTKMVNRLGEKYPVPVECVPDSYISVKARLMDLGAYEADLRLAGFAKDGPVITENGNFIIDARFNEINNSLEKDIKQIVGVIESGLFIGYNVKLIIA